MSHVSDLQLEDLLGLICVYAPSHILIDKYNYEHYTNDDMV
jgi:hypothetical protein